jgi:hypothetical protein
VAGKLRPTVGQGPIPAARTPGRDQSPQEAGNFSTMVAARRFCSGSPRLVVAEPPSGVEKHLLLGREHWRKPTENRPIPEHTPGGHEFLQCLPTGPFLSRFVFQAAQTLHHLPDSGSRGGGVFSQVSHQFGRLIVDVRAHSSLEESRVWPAAG